MFSGRPCWCSQLGWTCVGERVKPGLKGVMGPSRGVMGV